MGPKNLSEWKPNQLQEFNENSNIDLFLFPKSTSPSHQYSASRIFYENWKFMSHLYKELSKQGCDNEFTKIKLNHIPASKHDTNMVKYFIDH